ncbi:P-loop NTPase [Candidatus Portiera aleyrodidarum]|uniref:P-loop NTPase n=1 Tax=Candidatus Portiera aleyrodidarum TaxID=91844 RepID=UPI000C772533|nr:P-loop NTPase [Candidatus Portiera aleyrodidarum]AUI73354.1 chromosome partitioning protein [Candidatus Portiera aleyrodidarum]
MININYIITIAISAAFNITLLLFNISFQLAMNVKGYKVGLLDADIYGYSQSTILNVKKKIFINKKKRIQPIPYYGIKAMSLGFIVKKQTKAIIGRGPIISKLLVDLFTNTNWGYLDYLFIDMPPGTGDIMLSISKSISVSGVIIITTPQDVSLLGAFKGINMFNKIKIPIIGLIENMSYYTCKSCGYSTSIFNNKYNNILKKYKIKKIGCFALHKTLCDKKPILIAKPTSKISVFLKVIADIVDIKLKPQFRIGL